MGVENFITFLVTALLFVMTPGMDTVFVLNKSISQGRKSGVFATFGINVGVMSHTLLGALGVSVLLSQSDLAFTMVKYVGALYVVYLGLSKLINKNGLLAEVSENVKHSSKNDFWSGFMTNSLNPKVALFFLSFFPQFISPTQLENPIPYILLGVTYASIGIVWYLTLTFFASVFSVKIKNNTKMGLWINKISGLVFVIMGIHIILI
ncbi:LysE family translocator [Maribacter thermophilus]|uniref:LysE family translocator n=1 Tax=Maribacter thermophilus TaxID=1197874 RepID=UPI0006416D04|nr:LysE family translocator [Maribacter thermophilus]